MLQSIRQEMTWVQYALAPDSSFMAGVARYALSQMLISKGLLHLQWMLLFLEAAKHAAVARADWAEADRAERLSKRCKRIERRVVWRSRDRELRQEVTLKLGA